MTDKRILTKDDILNAQDYEIREVESKNWGGLVRLRSLTGEGRDEFEKAVSQSSSAPGKVDIKGLRALILTMSIVDEADNFVFTKEDAPLLNQKSAKVINELWDVVQEMNGIGEQAIEEAEKN